MTDLMTSASSTRSRNRAVPWGAIAVLIVALIAVLAPGLVSPADSLGENIADRLQPPSLQYWFGTDDLGRDLFSRVVHGARASLLTSLLALLFAFIASIVIGLLAGYIGGALDRSLMAVIDVLLAVPSLLISLLVVSGLGAGGLELAIAVGIASVPAFARLTRAEVLSVRTEAYVEAAHGFGQPTYRILLRHVLPHAAAPLAALAALEFATILLSVSTLSFLGYGVQPPDPEWGQLIAEGTSHFMTAWWLTTLPGLVLAAVVVTSHRLGRSFETVRNGVPQ